MQVSSSVPKKKKRFPDRVLCWIIGNFEDDSGGAITGPTPRKPMDPWKIRYYEEYWGQRQAAPPPVSVPSALQNQMALPPLNPENRCKLTFSYTVPKLDQPITPTRPLTSAIDTFINSSVTSAVLPHPDQLSNLHTGEGPKTSEGEGPKWNKKRKKPGDTTTGQNTIVSEDVDICCNLPGSGPSSPAPSICQDALQLPASHVPTSTSFTNGRQSTTSTVLHQSLDGNNHIFPRKNDSPQVSEGDIGNEAAHQETEQLNNIGNGSLQCDSNSPAVSPISVSQPAFRPTPPKKSHKQLLSSPSSTSPPPVHIIKVDKTKQREERDGGHLEKRKHSLTSGSTAASYSSNDIAAAAAKEESAGASFRRGAELILKREGKPLDAREIVRMGLEEGNLHTHI